MPNCHEKITKGRYRQFHQVGVEVFGIPNPEIDAELIILTADLWKKLGIFEHVTLQLNSIGSLEARKNYRQALVDFLKNHIDILDADSKRRLTTNPLRILDSKDQRVQQVLNDAPKLHDYLDDESTGLRVLGPANGIVGKERDRSSRTHPLRREPRPSVAHR